MCEIDAVENENGECDGDKSEQSNERKETDQTQAGNKEVKIARKEESFSKEESTDPCDDMEKQDLKTKETLDKMDIDEAEKCGRRT